MTSGLLNKKDLIKNFTIGFIPLLIFIIADELFGTRIGLLTAISVGILEFVFYFLRYRRIETFILFDVGLIVVLGAVSILLENEIFFKLKPALIELILLVMLGIHAFSDKPMLLLMGKRYMKDLKINDLQAAMMRKFTRLLFFIILAHVCLIVYAAYYMNKEAWAFISGGLFYVIFGLVFAGQWLYFRYIKPVNPEFIRANTDEEWFDLVDEKGRVTGRAARSAVHGNPKLLHSVVHLHVFNQIGQLYLQKRSLSKDVQPGKWDTSVGGHINAGEDVLAALRREAEEELGLKPGNIQALYTYVMRNDYESELVYSFRTNSNGPFRINTQEILFGKFWGLAEIEKNLGKNVFTPNFEQEFALLKKTLNPPLRSARKA
jgi:isopentenyldiphosphate isomerase/intracellular septation protein A